jgi:hypothetical protein
MEKHFESFLADCLSQGHTQVKLVPRLDVHGKIAFYAVGQGGPTSGETFDAVVEGKHVRRVVDIPGEDNTVEGFEDVLTPEEVDTLLDAEPEDTGE